MTKRSPIRHTLCAATAVLLNVACAPATGQTKAATIYGLENPVAVAVNPVTNKVYVANYVTNTVKNSTFCNVKSWITVIDGATNNANWIVPAGYCPTALAANPVTNKIYVVQSYSNNVLVINGATQGALTKIAVGHFPQNLAINPVTNRIYVTNMSDNTVSEIDGSTDSVINVSPVGENPGPIAVNPNNNKIYVANYGTLVTTGGSVTILNATTGTSTTKPVPPDSAFGSHPLALAVDPVTNLVYVPFSSHFSTNSDGLMVLDGNDFANFQEPPNLPITSPVSVAVNPTTGKSYVSNSANSTVAVIAWPTLESFPTAVPVGVQGAPGYFAVNPVSNNIYAVARFGKGLLELNGTTNKVTVLNAPALLSTAIALNSHTKKVYVANGVSNSVTVLGVTSPTGTTVPTGDLPVSADVNPVTDDIYVANSGSSNMTVVHGSNNTTTSIPVGPDQKSVIVNPFTNRVYISNGTDNVTVVNGATGAVVRNVPVVLPGALALNPVTNKVYVTPSLFSNSVTVINASLHDTTKTLAAGTEPRALAVNPVTDRIYVANLGSSDVTVIDGATDTAIGTVITGSQPTSIAVDSGLNRIYVANQGSNSLTVIDGATNNTSTIPVGDMPDSVAVNPITHWVYVANETSNNVTVLEAPGNSTLTVPVGTSPVSVAVDAANNTIYVANQGSNNATLIDGATNETSMVAGGAQPVAMAVNSVTDKAYMVNQLGNSITNIVKQHNQTVPLVTMIAGLPNNQSSNPSPVFHFTANSTFTPVAPPPNAVYFQVDTRNGAWTPATANGNGRFSGTVKAALSPGRHILYAYATDGQDATQETSPLIGKVAAYVFLIAPQAPLKR